MELLSTRGVKSSEHIDGRIAQPPVILEVPANKDQLWTQFASPPSGHTAKIPNAFASVAPFRPISRLEAENAVLRRQLIVLQRQVRVRIQFMNSDRLFFIQLYRWFPSIVEAMTTILSFPKTARADLWIVIYVSYSASYNVDGGHRSRRQGPRGPPAIQPPLLSSPQQNAGRIGNPPPPMAAPRKPPPIAAPRKPPPTIPPRKPPPPIAP
jgi:hypothetical protein